MYKDGDRIVIQANMIALEKLADIRDLNAKKLRLAIWMAINREAKC